VGGCPRAEVPVIDSIESVSSDMLLDEFGDCKKGAGGRSDAIYCPVGVIQPAT
jgi:hypothetical protein